MCVGEFAHNLRSALDQLVWQLAIAHGRCASQHGGGRCPGRHSEFPIRTRRDPDRMDVQLCGVGPAARAYIESVHPPRRSRGLHALNGNLVGRGLGILRDICNRDKHQAPLRARLQAEHPDRFSGAQLRTMQRRVKEWRGIMAKELVYAGTAETFAEPNRLPELALIGVDPRC